MRLQVRGFSSNRYGVCFAENEASPRTGIGYAFTSNEASPRTGMGYAVWFICKYVNQYLSSYALKQRREKYNIDIFS